MSRPIIIGFGHRSGVGKDTAVKFLNTHLRTKRPGLRVKKISFADKLKDVAYQLFSWAGVQRGIHYENKREDRNIIIPALNMTVVDLWIDLGEALRKVYPMVWVHYLTHHDHGADILLVPDIRHENEVNAILQRDGKAYKITNPRVPVRTGKSIDDYLADFTNWDGEFINDRDYDKLNLLMDGLSNNILTWHDGRQG